MKERLKEFLEIAKHNSAEAKIIFFAPEFKNVYLSGEDADNEAMIRYYDELQKGKNRSQIMEEFLIYAGLKHPVTFETEQDVYEFFDEKTIDMNLLLNGWGYEELSLSSNSYVELSQTLLTSEHFVDGSFVVTVDLSRVPQDMEQFEVTLATDYATTTVTFERKKEEAVSRKAIYGQMEDLYMAFRLGKLSLNEYAEETRKVLEEDVSMVAELFRLQMDILLGNEKEAKQRIQAIHDTAPWIVRMAELDEIYLRVVGKPEKEETDEYIFEDAFYSYLLALFDRNPLTIKSSVSHIRELKDKGEYEDALLWMLLYLDEEFVYSGKKQLIAIEEINRKHALPDYLRYEVIGIWNHNPLSVKYASQFNIDQMEFGLKHDIISKEVYDQFSRIIHRVDSFIGDGFYLLERIYEKHPEPEYLQSICKTILRTGQWDTRFHHYFEKAIMEDIKMEGLYEAYIHTMDKTRYDVMNPMVLHYFSYSNNLSPEEEAYLYANADRNRQDYGGMAGMYLQKMQYEVVRMMDQGIMTDAACYLYQKYLPQIGHTAAGIIAVPEILFKRKVICNNERMKYVVVKHFEKEQDDVYHLEHGIAFPDIYSEDAVIYFLDEQKDPHLGAIEWKMERLFKESSFYERCYEQNPYHEKLLLKLAHDYVTKTKLTKEEISVAKQLLDFQFLSEDAKELILELMLNFYYEEQDFDQLETLLKQVRWDKIRAKNRTAIIEYFITQKHYQEAVKGMEQYGYASVKPELLLEVAVYLKKMIHSQKSQFLLNICGILTRKDMVNVDILQYLQKYADADEDYAVDLWYNGQEKGYISSYYTERLLKAFANAGGEEERILPIFLYYTKTDRQDLSFVEKIIERFGRWYFTNGKNLPEEFFTYLTGYIDAYGWTLKTGPLAWLHYYSKKESLTEEQKQMAEAIIDEFVMDNICLAFFLKYEGKIELPKVLYEMTFVTYRGRTGMNPILHVQLKRGGPIKSVAMYEVLEGVYISNIRLFADERPDIYVTLDGEDRKYRKSLILENKHIKSVGTKFHKINEMISLISDEQVYDLMKHYEETEFIIDHMLEPWFK